MLTWPSFELNNCTIYLIPHPGLAILYSHFKLPLRRNSLYNWRNILLVVLVLPISSQTKNYITNFLA